MMAALAGSLVPQQLLHFSRQTMESTDGSVSLDSSDNFDRDSVNLIDNVSCCSDDTVLSVGNEHPNQVGCNAEPLSFKNIENHLNAISKISTNATAAAADSSHVNINNNNNNNSSSSSTNNTKSKFISNITENLNTNNIIINPNRCYNQHNLKQVVSDDNVNNNPRLKFSIDNILKADFGRRITDPLHIKKTTAPKRLLIPECTTDETKVPPPQPSVKQPVDLSKEKKDDKQPMLWPAWVYCTRYSDRPSSGPRTRRPKKPGGKIISSSTTTTTSSSLTTPEEKRPRTAFSGAQLARLKHEFAENRYLTEKRRQQLSAELGLNEAQIKIWFQNKRAKIKKASGQKNPLALQLMAQGLYNHSTIPLSKEEEELQEMHDKSS